MELNDGQISWFAEAQNGTDNSGWLLFHKGCAHGDKAILKRDIYGRRHFVLKGNMLFYKIKKSGKPTGLILLEGYSIDSKILEDGSYYFSLKSLISGQQNGVCYHFIADSFQNGDSWVQSLQRASIRFSRDKFSSNISSPQGNIEGVGSFGSSSLLPEAHSPQALIYPKLDALRINDKHLNDGKENFFNLNLYSGGSSPLLIRKKLKKLSGDEKLTSFSGQGALNRDSIHVNMSSSVPAKKSPLKIQNYRYNYIPDDENTFRPSSLKAKSPPVVSLVDTGCLMLTFAVRLEEKISNIISNISKKPWTKRLIGGEEKNSAEVYLVMLDGVEIETEWHWKEIGRTELLQTTELKHIEFTVPSFFQGTLESEYRFEIRFICCNGSNSKDLLLAFVECNYSHLSLDKSSNSSMPGYSMLNSSRERLVSSSLFAPKSLSMLSDGLSGFRGGDIIGQLFITVARPSSILSQMNRLYGGSSQSTQIYSQVYVVPSENHDKLIIQETLSESPYPILCALAMLRQMKAREKLTIDSLIKIVEKNYENESLEKIVSRRKNRIQYYENSTRAVLDRYNSGIGYHLRKSTEKKDENCQWISTNCNVHDFTQFQAKDSGLACALNTVVTVGAFAGHGFENSYSDFGRMYDSSKLFLPSDAEENSTKISYLYEMISTKLNQETKLSSDVKNIINQGSGSQKEFHDNSWNRLNCWVDHICETSNFITETISDIDEEIFCSEELSRLGNHLMEKSEPMTSEYIPYISSLLEKYIECTSNDDLAAAEKCKKSFFKAFGQSSSTFKESLSLLKYLLWQTALAKELTFFSQPDSQSNWLPSISKKDHDIEMSIHRREACLSQAIGAVVTCIYSLLKRQHSILHSTIGLEPDHKEFGMQYFWESLKACGYLVHFESLLSTIGEEKTMLQDMINAVSDLSKVSISFHKYETNSKSRNMEESNLVKISGSLSDKILVTIGVSNEIFESIPDGTIIKIHPVIFTKGVNEQQAIANVTGDTAIQDNLNSENFDKLRDYICCWKKWISKTSVKPYKFFKRQWELTRPQELIESIDSLMIELENIIYMQFKKSSKTKSGQLREKLFATTPNAQKLQLPTSTSLLVVVSEITRLLSSANIQNPFGHFIFYDKESEKTDAGETGDSLLLYACSPVASRITSCKSAKDRTGLSVTLEHALCTTTNQKTPQNTCLQAIRRLRSGNSDLIKAQALTKSSSGSKGDDEERGLGILDNIHQDHFFNLLAAMRGSQGVRLANIERNLSIGWGSYVDELMKLKNYPNPPFQNIPFYIYQDSIEKKSEEVTKCKLQFLRGKEGKFAFTLIQRSVLPSLFKPPIRSINGSFFK